MSLNRAERNLFMANKQLKQRVDNAILYLQNIDEDWTTEELNQMTKVAMTHLEKQGVTTHVLDFSKTKKLEKFANHHHYSDTENFKLLINKRVYKSSPKDTVLTARKVIMAALQNHPTRDLVNRLALGFYRHNNQ